LKVATADGVPIRRWTSSRLWVLTSSLSTDPGDGENPRRSAILSQAASRRPATASGIPSETVRRMDGFLGFVGKRGHKMSWRSSPVNRHARQEETGPVFHR